METPKPEGESNERGKRSTGLLALVALLLVSNMVMLYMLVQKNQQVAQKEERLGGLEEEKDNVTKLLEEMLLQYDTLSTDNEQLKAEMDAQQQQIKDLLSQVERHKGDAALMLKYRKEAGTLRDIMKGYVATIDSLNQANRTLVAENVNIKQELGEVTGQKQALESTAAQQAERISKGSVLHTTSLGAGALFLRSNGKQVDTDRSSKAELIKCCYTLGENRVTDAGNKMLYLRIISPDGVVLPASDSQNNRFTFNGTEGEYSVKREVNYQNQPVDVCMFWTASQALSSGQYIVELYESNGLVGKSTFDLK
jgi:hypothetical protein